MRQLIEFIEVNLDQPLTLDAMAGQVGISPLYLTRAFKAAVGQSPHQYLLARCIAREGVARVRLAETVRGSLDS